MTSELRHLTSINDLSVPEIESIFARAQTYLDELHDPALPHRIARSLEICSGSILASLFYEPSTRTRLSFESAMLRLGGKTISSADPATSSAAKGESLADTVRVASNYADILVVRHPRDGAAKLAAQYATVPIINGGDGSHEHPTQTLCDLFTLVRENKTLKNLNVAISGDLKGSRTIHSFVYALARFGAAIMPIPAKGLELPAHVEWRLRNEFKCFSVPMEQYDNDNTSVDALYITADGPHQLSLLNEPDLEITPEHKKRVDDAKKRIDAVYVTRYQKERRTEHNSEYTKVDAHFLSENKYRKTSVLHPLPRVGELDISLDRDPRAAYFRQAAYGVPIRMALIAALLGRDAAGALEKFSGGFPSPSFEIYDNPNRTEILCPNPNCVVHDPLEGQYAQKKLYVINSTPVRLRCFYCETDIEQFFFADRRSKYYYSNAEHEMPATERQKRDLILFASAKRAEAAGYAKRHGKYAITDSAE